jgi:hypothetical protein
MQDISEAFSGQKLALEQQRTSPDLYVDVSAPNQSAFQ